MSREVLAPPLLRMGPNRCYRVNLIHEDFGGNPAGRQRNQSQYIEQDLYASDDEDDDEGDYTLEELPNSNYKLTMHVAPAFYGGLIGFKGSMKRRLEGETNTEIFVPRKKDGRKDTGKKDEDLTIKGKTRSDVCAARRKIKLLVASLRKRMSATHFLCIPLNAGEIKQNFVEFKKKVLEANLPGIEEDIFQNENRIHLTLGVCVLLDDAERAKAMQQLEKCRNFLADLKTPFDIDVSGLEIFNDDPSAVSVLYARVVAPDLQIFADRALKPFHDCGLQSNYDRNISSVKLHMTLMNTKYGKKSEKLDAREILKRFGDFRFGTSQANEVQLCIINSGEGESFYKMTGSIPLKKL